MFRSDRPVPFEADSLIGSESEYGAVREYYGNCKWSQEDIVIKSDYAKQFIEINQVILKGNVRIMQPGMKMISPMVEYNDRIKKAKAFDSVEIFDGPSYVIADQGIYNADTKIADFKNRVKVEDDSSIVFADRIIYNRVDRSSRAYGNVSVLGKQTNAILTGDTIEHYPEEKYIISLGDPFLIQVDTLIEDEKEIFDTLFIKSKKMEAFFDDDERYFFSGELEIIRNSITAKADSGVFYKNRDYILLYGSPIAFYDSTQLYADTIKVSIQKNKLESIEANIRAISVLKDTANGDRKNQISGDNIIISFVNGKINELKAKGSTKSLYNFPGDDGGDGADIKDSESIRVVFTEGEADKIYWFNNINAQYIPEGILSLDPSKYNLPDYKWTDQKPKKTEIKVRKTR